MKKTILTLSMFVLSVLAFAPQASADTINVSLSSPIQSGTVGETLSFTGMVTAVADGLGPINLIDYGTGTTPVSPLVIDGTPFLLNFPITMSGGDTVTGLLFTVFLPADLAPGIYQGSFLILGGLDSNPSTLQATANFTVDATAPSAVPEPSTYALMVTGVGALVFAGFARRRSAFSNAA